MSWPVVIGVLAGVVGGINLGVMLMVALQAGKRQEDASNEAALPLRVQELEAALARQAGSAVPNEPSGIARTPRTGQRRSTDIGISSLIR